MQRRPRHCLRTAIFRRLVDHSVLEFIAGAIALREGEPDSAVTLLTEAAYLARKGVSPGREHVALFVLALALTEHGGHEQAELTLARATAHPSCRASPFHQWVVATIEANLADRRGNSAQRIQALRRALGLARAEGYDWAPGLSATGIMPRICALAPEHHIDRELVCRWIRVHSLHPPPIECEHWPWSVRIESHGHWRLQSVHAPESRSRK